MQSASGAIVEKRYWAFISYSHSDTKETEWLHKALENFKIPPSLVGTESRTGVVPKRIFPVFRDRDELPTSADLGANLHSALRNARYLVVVCSPKSAKSIWVNAEVEYFKKTHGNSNVLCLIVGGTPGGTGEGEDAECFCPALRHHINPDGSVGQPAEPIAADLRENKDGRLRAFLKIVAGILGVDFDALYQRERRRRRQRLILVASGLAVLAGVGIGVASAIIALSHPEDYAIIDFRNWKALYGEDKKNFTTPEYKRYLLDVRDLASKLDCDVQEVDYLLWKA